MKDFNNHFELRFKKAIEYRDKGDVKNAIRELDELCILHPDSSLLLATKASIYFLAEDYEAAIPLFAKASSIKPDSESISIGLFHSLWSIGRKEEALAEARRFVANYPSKEYLLLIQEMSDGLKEK